MKLDLIYPCHENLDSMPDTDKGKFCGQCSKEVVDFTAMSKDEVLNHLSKKRTCGIFRNDQLDKVHEPIVYIRPKQHFVRLALASVSVFVLSMFGCDDTVRDYDATTNGNESCNNSGVKKGRTSTTTLGAPRPMEVLVGDSIKVGEVEPRTAVPKEDSATQIEESIVHLKGDVTLERPEPQQHVTAGVPIQKPEPRVFGDIIITEKIPSFPGGETALIKYLKKNLKYPTEEAKNKIEGRVILVFDVQADGTINNVVVNRGVSEAIDKEAIRVVKKMPKWEAGFFDGKPAKISMTLPIQFSLDK